ncbi:hypothetical protein GUITHDRAFT_102975 [Guillardia theta CCMP2712]|uniref:PDEase domain-containing protein n=1 Tax=Guillardia theta (strain CCMP2712) TaxID=905079 RepID=L1JR58_GUITC|nr:hypothetical protein GUITHDRAFT_102975 [Guillardia theta CCMP2712]EKX51051.1 hypothetical protein GUITHDRAFT_102975 [Guillardia theta CCMP2712]|eukprot:XP_005838031.1 hypothetical protein GUITHDRAFT_102975 [Guillardia theta CCMP2712]
MYDNPYHNFHHAFDVTQTFYALLHITNVIEEISELLQFACLFSALCHDLEHLGVNNNFLSKEYIKDVITSLIMSTDMARHAEYLTMMRSRSTMDEGQGLTTITKLELLIKCADTSNVS